MGQRTPKDIRRNQTAQPHPPCSQSAKTITTHAQHYFHRDKPVAHTISIRTPYQGEPYDRG